MMDDTHVEYIAKEIAEHTHWYFTGPSHITGNEHKHSRSFRSNRHKELITEIIKMIKEID